MLAQEGYNIEVKSYEFKGEQWWLNMFLSYGHIVAMWIAMSKYRTETNDSEKKKIMIFGALAVFGFLAIGHMVKPQKISLEFEQK